MRGGRGFVGAVARVNTPNEMKLSDRRRERARLRVELF